MKQYRLTINQTPYTVRILEVHDDRVVAEVNGCEHVVGIEAIENVGLATNAQAPAQPGHTAAPPASSSQTPTGPSSVSLPDAPGTVTTPMPGQIIALHVNQGDRVKKGQKLLILEAMKLENVITATGDGAVTEILVAEGDVVSQGQPLLILS